MSDELTIYNPSKDTNLELFKEHFLVPSNWKVCGPAMYISGARGLSQTQPIALALTKDTLSICGIQGPLWSLIIGEIKDVKVEELKGISLPMDTPSGTVHMVPPKAYGLSISFDLTPTGAVGRLIIYMLTPAAAQEWENHLRDAIHDFAYKNYGHPDQK